MKIRKTVVDDIDILMDIYAQARTFMYHTGNKNQWIDGYPRRELIMDDIEKGHSYIILNDADEVGGTFCFFVGTDPTYQRIENGSWLNDEPYGVVHRLATGNRRVKGTGSYCLQWCYEQHNNIRVDTHSDNKLMQSIFLRNGFTECGIIYTHNGTPRVAYQKCGSAHHTE